MEIPILGSGSNLSSETSIHRQFRTLDFLSTGNVVGEISVLAQRPRSATLTCETQVKVNIIKRFTNFLDNFCIAHVYVSIRADISQYAI